MEDSLRDILEAFELEDNLTEDDYYTEDPEEEETDEEE